MNVHRLPKHDRNIVTLEVALRSILRKQDNQMCVGVFSLQKYIYDR